MKKFKFVFVVSLASTIYGGDSKISDRLASIDREAKEVMCHQIAVLQAKTAAQASTIQELAGNCIVTAFRIKSSKRRLSTRTAKLDEATGESASELEERTALIKAQNDILEAQLRVLQEERKKKSKELKI